MTLHPIKPANSALSASPNKAADPSASKPTNNSHRLIPAHGEPINVVSSEVREIVELFGTDGPLADVSFPEVDAVTFEVLIDDAREVAQQVADLRHEMALARESLAQAQAVLAKRAATALAYAKVFAVSDESLTATLEGTQLARKEAPKKKTRRRRRAPKPTEPSQTAELELPLSAAG